MAIFNTTNKPYPILNHVQFENVTSPNARGKPTPIPVMNMGNKSLPIFNKKAAANWPSAAIVIRNLIRGNTS